MTRAADAEASLTDPGFDYLEQRRLRLDVGGNDLTVGLPWGV